MADVHILERSGGSFRVAFHIAVPGSNNSAGISWANALVKSGRGGTTVLPDGTGSDGGIAAAEKTSIQAGTILEVVGDVPLSGTSAQINATLDAYIAARTTEIQAQLQAELAQFGRTRG